MKDTLPEGMTFTGSTGGGFTCESRRPETVTCPRKRQSSPLGRIGIDGTMTVDVAADHASPRDERRRGTAAVAASFPRSRTGDPGTIEGDPPILGVTKKVKERHGPHGT